MMMGMNVEANPKGGGLRRKGDLMEAVQVEVRMELDGAASQ